MVALHGCLLIGAAAVPIDLRLRDGERALRTAGRLGGLDELVAGAPATPRDGRSGRAPRR